MLKIARYEFSTQHVKKVHQSSFFRDIIGGFYNILIDEDDALGFDSDETVWVLGDRKVFKARQAPYFKSRPGFPIDRAEPQLKISFCEHSHGLTMSGDESAGWNPSDVIFDCMTNRMVWHALNSTDEISIILPCRDVGYDPIRHEPLIVYPATSSVARAVRACAPVIVDALEHNDPVHAQLLMDGFCHLVRSLFGSQHPEPDHAGAQALKLRVILRFIDQNLFDPALTPTQLCKAFGVSRAALYRLFEAYGGVADHIRNRRLDRAYAQIIDLQNTRSNISAVAGGLGFYDHAHFSHRFKERFGFAPRDLVDFSARRTRSTHHRLASNDNDHPAFIDLIAGPGAG